MAVSSISDYDHFRWREGLVCFKDVAFNELMTRFEKCYGIQIIVENKHLKEYTCSGNLLSDGSQCFVFCSGMHGLRLKGTKTTH
ncbi:MAG: DUF4974 domain-containing protein [Parabacteroides sp.]